MAYCNCAYTPPESLPCTHCWLRTLERAIAADDALTDAELVAWLDEVEPYGRNFITWRGRRISAATLKRAVAAHVHQAALDLARRLANNPCHSCGARPAEERGACGALCQRCWTGVCRVLGKEP